METKIEFNDRLLSLGLARVSEAAAIAATKFIGSGDEKKADQAAVDAMRAQLNMLDINGVVVSTQPSQAGNGFSNDLPSDLYRVGRGLTGEYAGLTVINQLAIFDTDESSNISTLYNSGVTQDLSLLSPAPAHYYEIDSSITTITDISGNADLTGYNFANTDLVTDTP